MRTEQARGVARRARIADAALEVFGRRGYGAASMDEIAACADTSKGGVYFHFPNKQAIFVALLDRMASLLRDRAEAALSRQPDPVARLDAALGVVFRTFAGYRALARLFLVDALGADRGFHLRTAAVHAEFAELIAAELGAAVAAGAIEPLDTALAGRAWFGALLEVVSSWVLADEPAPLEASYAELRRLLLRSVGVDPEAAAR